MYVLKIAASTIWLLLTLSLGAAMVLTTNALMPMNSIEANTPSVKIDPNIFETFKDPRTFILSAAAYRREFNTTSVPVNISSLYSQGFAPERMYIKIVADSEGSRFQLARQVGQNDHAITLDFSKFIETSTNDCFPQSYTSGTYSRGHLQDLPAFDRLGTILPKGICRELINWPGNPKSGKELKQAVDTALKIDYVIYYRPSYLFYIMSDKGGRLVASNIDDKIDHEPLPNDIYSTFPMDKENCDKYGSCEHKAVGPFFLESVDKVVHRSKNLINTQVRQLPDTDQVLYWPLATKLYDIEFFLPMIIEEATIIRVNGQIKDYPPGSQQIRDFLGSLDDKDILRPVSDLKNLKEQKLLEVLGSLSFSVAGIGASGSAVVWLAMMAIAIVLVFQTLLLRQSLTVDINRDQFINDPVFLFIKAGLQSIVVFTALIASPTSAAIIATMVMVKLTGLTQSTPTLQVPSAPYVLLSIGVIILGVISFLYYIRARNRVDTILSS